MTFPFFFALMFGDIGHGILLLSFAFLNYYSLAPKYEALNNVKYLLITLGFFSIFCGLIYNEFFGLPLLIFDSCYDNFSFKRKGNCVYSIGIDWIWFDSQNKVAFINSFKMKFSVIIGVIHMLLGIFLKILNSLNRKHFSLLFFEGISQFTFMLCIFGYMVFCIFVKWLKTWENKESVSIISLFINFLSVGEPLYSSQKT